MTVDVSTTEGRQQLRAWYSDPIRKLPRKVVADVTALLDALEGADRVPWRNVKFAPAIDIAEVGAAIKTEPPRAAYAKLSPLASAWLWGALSSVRDRAAREGGEVAAVVDALLDTLRSGVKTP